MLALAEIATIFCRCRDDPATADDAGGVTAGERQLAGLAWAYSFSRTCIPTHHAVPMPKQPHMGECRSAFQPR
jgi:hypothetical protein